MIKWFRKRIVHVTLEGASQRQCARFCTELKEKEPDTIWIVTGELVRVEEVK